MLKSGDTIIIKATIEADYGVSANPRYVAVIQRGDVRERIHVNEQDAYDIETHPMYQELKREKDRLEQMIREMCESEE